MWIARDAEGLLHLYEKKPIKTIYGWYATCGGTSLPSYLFPEVKWEDKEPRELILKYLCKMIVLLTGILIFATSYRLI